MRDKHPHDHDTDIRPIRTRTMTGQPGPPMNRPAPQHTTQHTPLTNQWRCQQFGGQFRIQKLGRAIQSFQRQVCRKEDMRHHRQRWDTLTNVRMYVKNEI